MLGSNVENLTLIGGAAINGTGNNADNSEASRSATALARCCCWLLRARFNLSSNSLTTITAG